MEDIARADFTNVALELKLSDELRGAVETAFRNARQISDPQLAASGAQNLLDQPEFHDLRKLRSILRIVEEQKTLYDLVAESIRPDADVTLPTVKIGHELGEDAMAECSLVTVPYRFGDRGIGMIAILGPRRMPYGRLMALASGTADSLGAHLDDLELR
jgi:heat-inducible transcriptional repressor